MLFNGIKAGVTPFRSDKMKSGEHSFVLEKELYAPKEVNIAVEDEKTASIGVELIPEFIWLSVRETDNLKAALYVDGSYKGRLPFRERLSYSAFQIEVKPDDNRYRPYYETISPGKRGRRDRALDCPGGNIRYCSGGCRTFFRGGDLH